MKTPTLLASVALLALALPVQSAAQAQAHVYPAKGQTPDQQQADVQQCGVWATQQSGFDPANPPVPATAKPAPATGSGARVRGAAVGATVGAVGGNDVGDAAAKGAVAGAVVQRSRGRRAAAAQNQAATQQVQASADSYQRARNSCLEGRGYTVK